MAGLAMAAVWLTLFAAGGAAEVRAGTGAWKAMAPGAPVSAGDHVRAQAPDSAWVSLSGGWSLQLGSGAEVGLGEAGGAVTVGVVQGEARLLITRGAEPASVALEVPGGAPVTVQAAAAGPLELRLTRREETLELAVVQGRAVVGTDARLGPGQAVELAKGKALAAFALLETPAVVRPATYARFFCPGLLVGLEWTPVGGAAGYRVQLSSDVEFRQVSRTVESVSPRTIVAKLPVGRSFFRVAAKDAAGHWSLPSELRPLPCEKDPPEDALQLPLAGAEVLFPSAPPPVTFSWAAVPGARYRIVVARGATLDGAAVVTQTVSEPRVTLSGLPEGELSWGVFLDDAVPYPLFVEPRRLSLRRRQAAGVTAPRTLKDWGKQ